MEPLVAYRRMLIRFCVISVDETTPKWKKLAHIIFCICAFTGNSVGSLISVAFCLKFVSIDLGKALYTLFQIPSMGSAAYGIVLMLVIKFDITKTFENLSKIYKKCNLILYFPKCLNLKLLIIPMKYLWNLDQNEDSFQYLALANSTSEWLWKMYSKFMICGFVIAHVTIAVTCLLACWLIWGEFNPNYSYHPYKVLLVLKSSV